MTKDQADIRDIAALGLVALPRGERGKLFSRIIWLYVGALIDDAPCIGHDEAGENARRFASSVALRVAAIERSGGALAHA
jgi:hypothetical protein